MGPNINSFFRACPFGCNYPFFSFNLFSFFDGFFEKSFNVITYTVMKLNKVVSKKKGAQITVLTND